MITIQGAVVTIDFEELSLSPAEWIARNPCPSIGRHTWMLQAANFFRHKISEGEAYDLIYPCVVEMGRSPGSETEREVRSQIRASYNSKGTAVTKVTPKIVVDLEAIRRRIDENFETTPYTERLRHISPVSPASIGARQAISRLFPDDPLLWVGFTKKTGAVVRWSKFEAFEKHPFIGPNPLKSVFGTNGGKTARNKGNIAEVRFMILECDWHKAAPIVGPMIRELEEKGCGAKQAQLANLWPVFKTKRVAMVVDSGNKSLHFWLYVAGLSDSAREKYANRAKHIGCDQAVDRPAQFFRMPDGRRETGERQRILYFNPNY